MLIKMTKAGYRLQITKEDIRKLPNTDNVILVGSDISKIIENKQIRHELHKKFATNDAVYFLCVDSLEKQRKVMHIDITESSESIITDNIVNAVDLAKGYTPVLYTKGE